jgi:hypothetical protein
VIDWKDGSRPAKGVVTTSGCRAEHTYTSAGLRRPVITVTDDDGGKATTTLPELVVYNRAAGPVVGAGLSASRGKPKFSLSAGYLPGASAPAGVVTLDLRSPLTKFRSAHLDWLVVTGNRAVLEGSGTVNGKSGYRFRVTATDGPDTFHIRIWKTSDGKVAYDTGIMTRIAGVVTVGLRHR